jgi:peptidoglycan hydrolase-like protein with peptidoglycan-binding domain
MVKSLTKVLAMLGVCAFLLVGTVDGFAAGKAAAGSQSKAVQSALNKEGYQLKVDGKMGRQTHAALMDFQKKNGLPATGKTDAATLKKLGVK